MQDNFESFSYKYYSIISEKTKFFREAKNLSQEALAEKIDKSREFINRLENKKEKPSLNTILKLAFVLSISPSDFFN